MSVDAAAALAGLEVEEAHVLLARHPQPSGGVHDDRQLRSLGRSLRVFEEWVEARDRLPDAGES